MHKTHGLNRQRIRLRHLPWLLTVALWTTFGCDGRAAGTVGDAAPPQDAGRDAAVVDADASPWPPADASTTCDCPAGEVYRNHACVPTTQIGCAAPCDPVLGSCGDQMRCEPCGAASSCADDDCQPACVYEWNEPIQPGDLRISPTWGPANTEADIRIQGHPWIVAAMFYLVWVEHQTGPGSPTAVELSSDGYNCNHVVRAPAHDPGVMPVWVSQYGGDGPMVLAGFYTYSTGEIPQCVQPGMPCSDASECCTASGMWMECDTGRCLFFSHYGN